MVWRPVVVLGALVGLLGVRPESRACPDCSDPDLPKDCSIETANLSGYKTCRHICYREQDECGVIEETSGSGRLDRSPYCKSMEVCKWHSGAREHEDKYEEATECCTDFGVQPKYPPQYLSQCKDKTQVDFVIEANGCGTR